MNSLNVCGKHICWCPERFLKDENKKKLRLCLQSLISWSQVESTRFFKNALQKISDPIRECDSTFYWCTQKTGVIRHSFQR